MLLHFIVTFYLFHWHKGSPIASDQGAYDRQTFWEQVLFPGFFQALSCLVFRTL